MKERIRIKNINTLRDGGTICITCDNSKQYFIDHRIGTKTSLKLYDTYPNSKSKPLPPKDAIQIKKALLFGLKEYGVLSNSYIEWYSKFKEIHAT